MDKFFKISERGSTVKAEIVGGLTTFFERLSSKIRRMKYGNAFYRPDCGNDILWTRESTHVDRTISPLARQRMEFNDSELQEMLSELAKVRISFLAE